MDCSNGLLAWIYHRYIAMAIWNLLKDIIDVLVNGNGNSIGFNTIIIIGSVLETDASLSKTPISENGIEINNDCIESDHRNRYNENNKHYINELCYWTSIISFKMYCGDIVTLIHLRYIGKCKFYV